LRLADDLREYGRVRRAWLGVTIMTPFAGQVGVMIEDIDRNGALADTARIHDLITAFDGKPVTTPLQLSHLVQALRPSTSVHLTVVRGGDTLDLAVTLAEQLEP
jgi:S1-C subfamily serine protease